MLFAILTIDSPNEDQVLEFSTWIDEEDSRGSKVMVVARDLNSSKAIENLLKAGSSATFFAEPRCSTIDDWCALAALAAASHSERLDRFVVLGAAGSSDDACSLSKSSEWTLLLRQLAGAFDERQPLRADSYASALRSSLLRTRGAFVSALNDLLGDLRSMIDCCQKGLSVALTDAVSLLVYSRKKPLETWIDLHASLEQEVLIAYLIARRPGISTELTRLAAFYRDGRLALAQDRSDMSLSRRPQMISALWLAAYLSRVCEYHISAGDGAGVISLASRTLETYIEFRMFEFGYLYFDVTTQSFERTGKGARHYASLDRSFGTGLRAAVEILIGNELTGINSADVEQVIQLRNRSQLTHSVQRLDALAAASALTAVKTFINSSEKTTPAVGARWQNILASSFHVDWKAVGQRNIGILI